MSAKERSGWRDEALSLRHREWGFNAPIVDIDFLVAEYDKRMPVALVEYGIEGGLQKGKNDPACDTLRNLCKPRRHELPLFGCRYSVDLERYRVTPLNGPARSLVVPDAGLHSARMSEVEYVEFIYRIRGREVPADVREHLERRRIA